MQVVELHDCFSCNELITYEALGLCEEGKWLSVEEFVVRALLPLYNLDHRRSRVLQVQHVLEMISCYDFIL